MTPVQARALGIEAGKRGLSDRIPSAYLVEMLDEAIDEYLDGHAQGTALRQQQKEAA